MVHVDQWYPRNFFHDESGAYSLKHSFKDEWGVVFEGPSHVKVHLLKF